MNEIRQTVTIQGAALIPGGLAALLIGATAVGWTCLAVGLTVLAIVGLTRRRRPAPVPLWLQRLYMARPAAPERRR